MAGTYASALLILLAAAGTGQALFALCGRREWSWLAPAVGLGLLCALAWGAINLTGKPGAGLVACAAVLAGGASFWVPSVAGALRDPARATLATGLPVALAALVLASLPFLVEQRFGILGTSLNPDMSQHLFAADRLATGGEERLIAEGYPLGPHALVVSIAQLGPSLVHAFGGLTLAIAVVAAVTPLGILARLSPARRAAGALLVGFAYMTASYLVQGAFKETLQAVLVLAFALAVHGLARAERGEGDRADRELSEREPAPRWRVLRAVPLAALGAGAIYVYSFPGLAWMLAGLGTWALAEAVNARGLRPLRAALVPAAVAAGVLALATAPELGRIATFADFETFEPAGAGLGNLFNPISPLEALGIWPSGDFRLDPGAGFAPTAAFWLGSLLALAALAHGLVWWLRRGELAVPAFLAAAASLYLYALLAGTPYQEAKAIAIAAPLAMLGSVRALLGATPEPLGEALRRGGTGSGQARALGALAIAFSAAAALCSALALANGPVGPSEWGPGLIELRESGRLGPGGERGDDTLVLAPAELLADEHGEDILLWELRGGNVCVAATGAAAEASPGAEHVVRYAGPGSIEVTPALGSAPGPHYPFIADGARADPGATERECPVGSAE